MSSTTSPPADDKAKKPSAAPLHGYYAVRKGKHGLRDCIFVSWDRAKEFVDSSSDDDKKEEDGTTTTTKEPIEFSFFAKVEDAIQYLHPHNNHNKSYAELCSNSEKADSNKKEPNKRKRMAVLGQPTKKIRIPTHGKSSDDTDKKEGEMETMADGEGGELAAAVKAEGEVIMADAEETEGGETGAPLNVLLEQAFQQNLPKGWRSQSLGLYLTRRDHFREPALKQYMKDLVDLQNYRELKSVQGRAGHTELGYRHFSGASHPLSVYYLNWSWGVCNSYHRDIRRQQKHRLSNTHQLTDGVELPHFKAHPPIKLPGDPGYISDGASDEPSTKPSSTSTLTPASGLPHALEQAYLGFRERGWRAREVCAKMKNGSDEPKPASSSENEGKPTTVVDDPKPANEGKPTTVGEEPKPATGGKEEEPAEKSQENGEPKSTGDEGTTGDKTTIVGVTDGSEKTDNANKDAETNVEPSQSDNNNTGSSKEENPENGGKEDPPEKITESKIDNTITSGGTTATKDNSQPPDSSKDVTTSITDTSKDDNRVDEDVLEIQFQKDFKELLAFRDAHPEEIQRYRGSGNATVQKHPSGIQSPFAIRYLKWAWDKEVDDNDDSSDQKLGAAVGAAGSSAGSSKRKGPSLPTRPKSAEAAAPQQPRGQTNPVAVALSAAPSQPTPAAVPSTENDGEDPNDGSDSSAVDEDTPPLIEALRASWFAGKEKGWRASELGFPEGGNNRKYNTTARKERERLYLIDLEVLKKWWKTYPSSQHYVFTVPEDDGDGNASNAAEAIDRSKFPYGRSGKNNMCKFDRRHKSGINAPWSLTYLNWSWGVSNSYNRDLTRKEKRKSKSDTQQALYI